MNLNVYFDIAYLRYLIVVNFGFKFDFVKQLLKPILDDLVLSGCYDQYVHSRWHYNASIPRTNARSCLALERYTTPFSCSMIWTHTHERAHVPNLCLPLSA